MCKHIMVGSIFIGLEVVGGTLITKIFWVGISLIVFGIVGLLIIYLLGKWIRRWLSKIGYNLAYMEDKGVKMLVFPYIRTISASPVASGEEYLSLSVFFPSALLKDITLSLTGELMLDGSPSNELPSKKVTISSKYVARLTDWHTPLTKNMINEVKDRIDENIPIRATLKLRDKDGKYSWETEEWTTLLLTRVN